MLFSNFVLFRSDKRLFFLVLLQKHVFTLNFSLKIIEYKCELYADFIENELIFSDFNVDWRLIGWKRYFELF